jgi:ASC-1-like (ASCH) protein
MRIDDKYLDLIKKGYKKHEYRLNSEKYHNICIGDNIILISNSDENDYISVLVKNKQQCKSWLEALQNFWKDDFKNLYSSLEETISYCKEFYGDNLILEKGLLVFEIEYNEFSIKEKKILLCEDIVNQKESYSNVSTNITSLYNWLEKLNCRKYICFEKSNQNEESSTFKKIINYQSNSYSNLDINEEFSEVFEENLQKTILKINIDKLEFTDKLMLFQVYCGKVDYMITDDENIVDVAKYLYLKDKVFIVNDLLKRLEQKYPKDINYKMLSVKLEKIGVLDINDQFFDSLKEIYKKVSFTKWLEKKAQNYAYVFFDEKDSLKGFLYLKIETKEENYDDITPILLPKRRLKVGTFKTNIKGFRLGERFIRIIFDNAVNKKVDEIYVTLFENEYDDIDYLRDLLCKWGFKRFGKKNNGEAVFVKTLEDYNFNEDSKFNFPIIKSNPNFYFLPIKPEFHTDLFPDNILKSEDERFYEGNIPHRYSLEKIYVSNAKYLYGVNPGDLVLIYRTKDKYFAKYSSVVTGIAIIQKICNPNSLKEYLKECSNKSIFSDKQLKNFFLNKNYRTVIKLLDYKSFDKKVILNNLYDLNIVSEGNGPRPFTKITKEQYTQILKKSKL